MIKLIHRAALDMPKFSSDLLRRAVEYQHGGTATFVQSVPVHEEQGGQVAWEGMVHVFDLRGQPDGAFRAYAWSCENPDGKRRFSSLLHGPQIYSPILAIRAALAAEQRRPTVKPLSGIRPSQASALSRR